MWTSLEQRSPFAPMNGPMKGPKNATKNASRSAPMNAATLWRAAFIMIHGLAAMTAVCGTAAAATNEAVLVLGFPRSMWVTIGGQPKAALVKKALGRAAPAVPAGSLDLGITVFGHAGASCDDVATARGVGPVDGAALVKSIESFRPKGVSPLAAAIRHAHAMFQPGSHPKTLIVVADSLDSCKGDPCAAVAALRQTSGSLTVHMVAFDRSSREKLKGLSCVAENGKGQFTAATSEAELETALRSALSAAAGEGSASAAAGAPPQPGAAPHLAYTLFGPSPAARPAGGPDETDQADSPQPTPPPAAQDAPPATGAPAPVTFTAFLARGTPPLASPGLVWRIYEGRARDDGSYHLLHTLRAASPTAPLKPGLYLVNAAYGKASLTKRIAVWPGKPLQDDFILNAGGLRLYATLNKTQVIPDTQVTFDIYSEVTDQSGARLKVIARGKPGVIFRLNNGTYHVVTSYGDCNASVESDIAVEAGRLAEATFDHEAARITFRLVDRPGGEALADTRWTLSTLSGETIKESAGAFPTHILAAGKYKVTAHHGSADYAQDFVVKAGENRQEEVVTR